MSLYSSPASSAQEDVNKPDISNDGGGGSIVLTDVLHMYVIHAHGLYWRLHLHHRSLLLPLLLPDFREVWPYSQESGEETVT